MEKLAISTAFGRLKKSFWLLFSTIAALCLLLAPSLASLLLIAVAFCGVVAAISLNYAQTTKTGFGMRVVASVIAIIIQFANYHSFKTTWSPSGKVAALAGSFNLSSSILLTIVGFAGFVVGFYAVYILSTWIVIGVKSKLPEQEKSNLLANLKRNWYFPISAIAFFCLNATLTVGYLLEMLIAFGISVVISSQTKSIYASTKENATALRIVSFLTAIGICWAQQATFYANWSVSSKAQALETLLSFTLDIPGVISIIGAVNAVYFVTIWINLVFSKLKEFVKESKLFADICIAEWLLYGTIFVVICVTMTFAFFKTNAFYGGDASWDIIYTFDSPNILKTKAHLIPNEYGSNYKHMLFFCFAMPFAGIPYLIGNLLSDSIALQAILLNVVQIAMLLCTVFILAKILGLSVRKRICFIMLFSVTYTAMLSYFAIELYIILTFWLVLALYSYIIGHKSKSFFCCGAAGTLITSAVLLVDLPKERNTSSFIKCIQTSVLSIVEFLLMIAAFGRLTVVTTFLPSLQSQSRFTGKELHFIDKLQQYTVFVKNFFMSPSAEANQTFQLQGYISWQLTVPTEINFFGVTVIFLSVISLIFNRNKISSQVAGCWIVLSIFCLLIVGWGTAENGLILYSLYFCWAFFVLLFQLVEKIEDTLKIKFLIPLVSFATIALMLYVNIPAIIEMVNFAITYYPA